MRYRRLGRTGLQVSELALGTWATVGDSLDFGKSARVVERAFDLGVNFFDTAGVYAAGNAEEMLGMIFSKTGWPREDFVVSTKVMWGTGQKGPNRWGLSKKHVLEAVEGSLRRLKLPYIDILYCHRADPNTPLDETIEALSLLLRSGKILYWGTSHWPAELIREAQVIARDRYVPMPVVEQSQYNIFERKRVEVELVDCIRDGLGLCAWSPLSYGILAGRGISPTDTGRINRVGMEWLKDDALGDGKGSSRLQIARAMLDLASEAETTSAALALAWVLGNETVSSAVTGASSILQLESNIRALERLGNAGVVRSWVSEQLGKKFHAVGCGPK